MSQLSVEKRKQKLKNIGTGQINEIYGLPESRIPNLKLIPILPSQMKAELMPVLHKYIDSEWMITQKTDRYVIPTISDSMAKLLIRLKEIENSDILEFYEDENGVFKVKRLDEIADDALPSKKEIKEFTEKIKSKRMKSTYDVSSVIDPKAIKNSMNDFSKSGTKSPAKRILQDLKRQTDEAQKEIDRIINPKLSGSNPLYDDMIEDLNEKYLKTGIEQRSNLIIRHIYALVKYTEFDIDMFGPENKDLKVAMGDIRTKLEGLKEAVGIEKIYWLQDIISAARIVVPPDEILTQKRIVEPSSPSSALRVSPEQLVSAGSDVR